MQTKGNLKPIAKGNMNDKCAKFLIFEKYTVVIFQVEQSPEYVFYTILQIYFVSDQAIVLNTVLVIKETEPILKGGLFQ